MTVRPAMLPDSSQRVRSSGRGDWLAWFGPTAIVAGAVAAYSRIFSVPLLFDDEPAILRNASIRHWATAFWPPAGTTTSGRPVVNLSLALNYAISGTGVWSYHLVNLVIHVAAGLTLYGLARRLLVRSGVAASTALAVGIALTWTLHPIQTEAVTYIVQRAEALMGLFYLQTLYGFVRWREALEDSTPGRAAATAPSTGPRRGASGWAALSLAACVLGMATKEVMVSAPVLVLLIDRAWWAGSFRQAWRSRPIYYLGLAATELILIGLAAQTGNRGGTSGFGSGVSVWHYWVTQPEAIARYLKLAIWPHPLVFDYGTAWLSAPGQPATGATILVRLLGPALIVGGLAGLTLRGLWRNRPSGVLGFFFFAILAPTSVIPGNRQTAAEHRMYLALIPLVVIGLWALHRRLGRAAWPVSLVLAAVLGLVTVRRNQDYVSAAVLWADTVRAVPENHWAHNNFGTALAALPGRLDDAIAQFQEALRLDPSQADVHYNLGNAWAQRPGQRDEAIGQYEEALRLSPNFTEAHFNLANLLVDVPGRRDEAIGQYEATLRLKPDYAEARLNLGTALADVPGRLPEAISQFEEALRLKPDYPQAHVDLGNALAQTPGRLDDAVAQYEAALRLKPDYAEAHFDLGNARLAEPGHLDEAIAEYRQALGMRPHYAEAHLNLGIALANEPGRAAEAIAEFREALRINPDYPEAHLNLGIALQNQSGQRDEAIAQFEEALRLNPNSAEAHFALAAALADGNSRLDEAEAHLRAGLRLRPDFGPAQLIWERIREARR